jgi:AcrR family transcriptional regulator
MDTRTTILNAAVEVFSQHGFRGSTTRRIADAAEVNEVTIFRYFGSKEALLQEAINLTSGPEPSHPLPADPVDPEAELTGWATAVIRHLQTKGPVIRKCMSEMEERPDFTARTAEAPTRATNELCAYFRRLKELRFTGKDFDETVASATLIAALFHDAMSRPVMPDIFPKPAENAPRKYAQFVLAAIGVENSAVTKRPTHTL